MRRQQIHHQGGLRYSEETLKTLGSLELLQQLERKEQQGHKLLQEQQQQQQQQQQEQLHRQLRRQQRGLFSTVLLLLRCGYTPQKNN